MSTLIPKFKQDGTGAVNRDIGDKLREVVSVLDFGADPTGSTDSSGAIQAAIDACAEELNGVAQTPISKSVFFPSGSYLIETPLNLTADDGAANRRGIRLFGPVVGSGDYAYGTKLIGATNGKAIVEIVDNDNFQMVDLTLTNHTSTPSTVGIYQARRTGGTSPSQWSGNCYFKNITVTFSNDGITQNSNFGTIGIINVAGEETTYDHCEVWANTPLVLSWSSTFLKAVDALTASTYDSFQYTPVHATVGDITTGASNTVFRTKDCRFIAKGWNSPTVLLYEIGSYFSYGDFTQKRNSTTGPNGTNGIGYELWNAAHIRIDAAAEAIRTPLLFHRGISSMQALLRGADGGVGQTVGLIHVAPDAPSYTFNNADISLDYVGAMASNYVSYATPSGTGGNEPSVVTFSNSKFAFNGNYSATAIDPKIVYKAANTVFNFLDLSLQSDFRYLKIPVKSKSIGVNGTTTSIIEVALPAVVGNTSGCSITVSAHLHVSQAEVESLVYPSSMQIEAKWQITRLYNGSDFAVTSSKSTPLICDLLTGTNTITDLTLSETKTGGTSVTLKVAPVQGGTQAATSATYISGYVEVLYAGGYSRAPSVTLL